MFSLFSIDGSVSIVIMSTVDGIYLCDSTVLIFRLSVANVVVLCNLWRE